MKAKKFLALALVLALAMTLLPTAALGAESDFTIENGVLTKYNGPGGDVTIPSSVTSIESGAFQGCTSLTSITIPEYAVIWGGEFSGCTGLNSISVVADNRAFTSRDGVLFSKDMTKLVAYPGGRSGSYVIPSSVTTIGNLAFGGCTGLTDIVIPESVTTIGIYAFADCTGLTNVVVPGSVTTIGDYAFHDCTGLNSITIREGVIAIEDCAFAGCSALSSVIIPEGLTTIDYMAFFDCTSLTSITIPNSVTAIGSWAFYGCTSLTNITIPEGVTTIENHAFCDCKNLTSVTIPKSVTAIEDWAFYGCEGLASITIPKNVTTIGADAFAWTSLANVTIPGSTTTVKETAFKGCADLTEITVAEDNIAYVSMDGVLFSKDMSTLVIYPRGKSGSYIVPDGVTTIGAEAFSNCRDLTSITIPKSVTSIEESAFDGCTSLTSVVIPEGVITLGDKAFSFCTSLKVAKILSKTVKFGLNTFEIGFSDNMTVYGYAGSTAETFCKENNIPFDLLENAPADPSPSPSTQPSTSPSTAPSVTPSSAPSAAPSVTPSAVPSVKPSAVPSAAPSNKPSVQPSAAPSSKPSAAPSAKPSAAPVAVTGVSVAKTADVQLGKSKTLTATVTPSNATNKGVYWTSADTGVVTVDRQSGRLSGVSVGTANVTVTTLDGGFRATCAVTVYTSSIGGGGGGGGGGALGGGGGGGGGGATGGGGGAKPSAPPSDKPIDTSKPASENFSDVVKDSWYEAGVTYVVKKGLFNGVAQGQFAPQQNMTRAMLVTVLARLDGQDTTGGATWYAKATDWAKAQGVSDGTMLDQSVTREQMVTMLYRYAKAPAGAGDLSQFADSSTISDWAKDAMAWAVANGILTGKDGSRLDPQGTATRAEVATILQRFVEHS